MEELARDKHSSLLQKFVIYGWKKFYNIGSWAEFSTIDVGVRQRR
jgi:hypothetical protein